ncbi:hypothetical protein [Microbacterium sp. GXS0129]|uniref:hypothetical protein n=1 Tax=Microbacterium sp. GXS0129 TaxID=3377836 RepID=UPI00383A1283
MNETRIGTDRALLPAAVLDAADEVAALANNYESGRFAMGLSGSWSKGTSDSLSDVDFRCYSDVPRPTPDAAWEADWNRLFQRWEARGLVLDGLGWTTVSDVDAMLDTWLAGRGVPEPIVWTIWGYHPLTDYSRQLAVIDPDGLIVEWRERTLSYPDELRRSIVRRYLPALQYWRGDYHYANKVRRADEVFLAGLTSLLVHNLLQVLAAYNRVHYPGDGNNLRFVNALKYTPADLVARLTAVLSPGESADRLSVQHAELVSLIDDVIVLLSAESELLEVNEVH